MRFVLFITIALSVFALLTYYVQKRFINKLHLNEKEKKYLTIFLIVNFLGIIGYMYGRYDPIFPNWLYFLLSLPIGLLFLFFSMTLVYDISRVVIEKIPFNEKRRKFFKNSLDLGAFAVAIPVVGVAVENALHIEVEKVNIGVKNLKGSYNIVQLSDIHIGGIIDASKIREIVTIVNELNPDLVVITGDLVDIKLEYAKEALQELKGLQSRYGTYFIVGNHEYIHGIEPIVSYVNSLGIQTLENKSVYIGDLIDGFNLAGVYDLMGERVEHHKPDLEKTLDTIKTYRPTILLAHQPRYIKAIQKNHNIDLVLSGHTHGGQIFPFNYLVRLQQPYISGLYQHDEITQIYVNKGTGFWGPPMRLGTSCEITHIQIHDK